MFGHILNVYADFTKCQIFIRDGNGFFESRRYIVYFSLILAERLVLVIRHNYEELISRETSVEKTHPQL